MKKIVTVSGGTGGYNLLSAIKDIPNINISSVVCMTDNGGTTGVLRDELGVLPPGDVRQCLTALSEETDTVRKLMSYRFENGTLSGFSFGSIFLAALEKVSGHFNSGVETASRILKIKGKVIPVIESPATLVATLSDGTTIEGEYRIYDHADKENPISRVGIKETVEISQSANKAITECDFLLIGPGDYFCSILPNLVVPGFKDSLQNFKGKIIYIANLTNRSGHTLGWSLMAYVGALENILERKIDFVIVNNKNFTPEQIQKYLQKEGIGVEVVDDMVGDKRVFRADVLSVRSFVKQLGDVNKSYIRHDSKKLKNLVETIIFQTPTPLAWRGE
jgi:uncharacterized cofD-like protein